MVIEKQVQIGCRVPRIVDDALDKCTGEMNKEQPIRKSKVIAMAVVDFLKDKGYLEKSKIYL